MIKMYNFILATLLMFGFFSENAKAQFTDWRNVEHGIPIYTNGYIDQPYVVVLSDRSWLVVFTTGAGAEGTGGQHIVASRSTDQGKTWSEPVRIEEPSDESASWAMPYLTDFGRIYVFYDYNGDKIHDLGDRKNIREDMLGWYCYKYSDDKGKTWSERYRLPVRNTAVDLNNDWSGKVQILWGIGKPIDLDHGMMFAFTKIGRYMLEDSEGWFFRCDNINTEKNVKKLKWEMLPVGEKGLKNTDLGTVNAEQNIVQMSNGMVYCMHRTISGFPAESYSADRGNSWTLPVVPRYYDGRKIKHPRACPRIWKCSNGNYLFWHHFNGGWDFLNRNPVWISGGVEKDGKIIWSQPEILFYEKNPAKRMSYPDLIEQDGRYWITETNKEDGRCHEVPAEFLNKVWSQFTLNEVSEKGLVLKAEGKELEPGKEISLEISKNPKEIPGYTIEMVYNQIQQAQGQEILSIETKTGLKASILTGAFGAVVLKITNGEWKQEFHSDAGIIKGFGDNSVTVSIDNASGIVQFVINGIVNDGDDYRQFGWSRSEQEIDLTGQISLKPGKLAGASFRPESRLKQLRIYNRPLMNTEIIGNHRANTSMFNIPSGEVLKDK